MSSSHRRSKSAPKYTDAINSDDSDVSEGGISTEEAQAVPTNVSSPTPRALEAPLRTESSSSQGAKATPTSMKETKGLGESGIGITGRQKSSPRKQSKLATDGDEGIDVVIPSSLLGIGTGAGAARECTVLIQIDPQDASTLDFHGASGAVGRFEADDDEIKMDLKGFQYTGTINPGPTAMVASMTKGGQLKIESITDEFVTLRKTQDVMAQLDAVVEGDMDRSYNVTEDDVNRGGKSTGEEDDADSSTRNAGKSGKTSRKRKRAEKKSLGAKKRAATRGRKK